VITEVKQRNKLINKNTHAHTQKPPPVLREENFAICWFSFQFEHAFEMEKKAKKENFRLFLSFHLSYTFSAFSFRSLNKDAVKE
jgi:hypothetical protein